MLGTFFTESGQIMNQRAWIQWHQKLRSKMPSYTMGFYDRNSGMGLATTNKRKLGGSGNRVRNRQSPARGDELANLVAFP